MPREAVPHYLYDGLRPDGLEEIEREFLPGWLSRHLIPDKELFHYTSIQGMQGIIGGRSLWLSDITSFNDPDEIEYGKRMANSALEILKSENDCPTVKWFLDGMRPWIESFGKVHNRVFVVCFCEEDDLVGQWRDYADKGRGYSLGFRISSDTKAVINTADFTMTKELYVRRVIYDEEEQMKWIVSYLKYAIAIVRQNSPTRPEAYSMSLEMVNLVLDMLLCFKHKGFAGEKEWRVFRVTQKDHELEGLKVRNSLGLIVPYRPIFIFDKGADDMAVLPLRSITCGPALEFDQARSGLEEFLRQVSHDTTPIKLVPSEIKIKEPGYRLRSPQA